MVPKWTLSSDALALIKCFPNLREYVINTKDVLQLFDGTKLEKLHNLKSTFVRQEGEIVEEIKDNK